jgi:hypothetical protein
MQKTFWESLLDNNESNTIKKTIPIGVPLAFLALRRRIAYSAALGICSFRAYLISVILRWTLKELRTFIGVVWLLVSTWNDLFFSAHDFLYDASMLASDRGCSEFSLSLRKSLRKILPRVTVERWGVCVCVCRAGWCESVPRRWKNKNKTLSPQKFKRCMLVSLVKQAWLMSIQHATYDRRKP